MEIGWYFERIKKSLDRTDRSEINDVLTALHDAYSRSANIFVIGNGGSAANASHFAQDLAKGVFPDQKTEPRFRAISLTDNVAYISALANDDGYEDIFEAQLRTYYRAGDVLIAISGSGNSPNVLKAAKFAKSKGLVVVGITGYDGGQLLTISDLSIHVRLNEMCTVESIHSLILHYIVLQLRELFGQDTVDARCFPA